MWRFDDPLIGCFGYIIAFDGFRADPLFIEEFDGRTEEVMRPMIRVARPPRFYGLPPIPPY